MKHCNCSYFFFRIRSTACFAVKVLLKSLSLECHLQPDHFRKVYSEFKQPLDLLLCTSVDCQTRVRTTLI